MKMDSQLETSLDRVYALHTNRRDIKILIVHYSLDKVVPMHALVDQPCSHWSFFWCHHRLNFDDTFKLKIKMKINK